MKEGTFRFASPTPLAPWQGGRVRTSDPETSFAAARSITPDRLRTSQRQVYGILKKYGPLTDAGIYSYLVFADGRPAMSSSGARTRRSELVALGVVEDTGQRETLPSGRKSVVWGVASS